MSPQTKWLAKSAGVGLYAFFTALAAVRAAGIDVGWSEVEDAAIAGAIGLLGFLGLAKTPLENPGGEPPEK